MQRWSAKNVGPASFDANAQDGSSRTDEEMKIRLSAFVGRLITKIRLKFKIVTIVVAFGRITEFKKADAAYLNLYKRPYKLKIFIALSVLFGC